MYYFVFIFCEEKGEVFRKSLCCVPCSDSGDSDGVDSDTDNQKKTRKPEKSEGKNVKESGKERRKKESHKKVLLYGLIIGGFRRGRAKGATIPPLFFS